MKTKRYRCRYSFPCQPFDRHCYEVVPIDAEDPPGHCNDDSDGEDPDWMPGGTTDLYGNPVTSP